MPGTSHVLTITVYESDGTTAQASAAVTITDETTSETQSVDTNAQGQAIFNLSNFSSGWTVGDLISVNAVYVGSDASDQFTATDTGSTAVSLTLVASTSSASLRYFNTPEFYTTFDLSNYTTDTTNGIREARITEIGAGVEAEIDNMFNTKFDDNDGSYYTATDEYHNANSYQNTWWLKNAPVQSITSFSINEALPGESEDWNDLKDTDLHEDEELDIDLGSGRVTIAGSSDFPEIGHDQVKVTYTYGRSSVPGDIKWLAMIMTMRRLAASTPSRVTATGIENEGLNSATINLAAYDEEIKQITESRRFPKIANP